jgi:peptidoglycan hydrolase-like protein with peptidoglycan-binding domain
MTRAETRRMQQHLNRQGLGPLTVDGIYGPATERAYQRYLQFYTPVDDAPTPPAAKPWWTSRALWGALATILISIAGIFIDVSSIDAAEVTNVLVSMSTGIAGLLALYGTITRKAPIDPTLAAPGVRWGAHRARADGSERMQPEPMQAGIDATEKRNSAGFPEGPFFDS